MLKKIELVAKLQRAIDEKAEPCEENEEEIRNLVNKILAWDKQDVRHLNKMLTDLNQACSKLGNASDYLDFTSLPSVDFEAGTEEWAMDVHGNKLVGQCVPFDICLKKGELK